MAKRTTTAKKETDAKTGATATNTPADDATTASTATTPADRDAARQTADQPVPATQNNAGDPPKSDDEARTDAPSTEENAARATAVATSEGPRTAADLTANGAVYPYTAEAITGERPAEEDVDTTPPKTLDEGDRAKLFSALAEGVTTKELREMTGEEDGVAAAKRLSRDTGLKLTWGPKKDGEPTHVLR